MKKPANWNDCKLVRRMRHNYRTWIKGETPKDDLEIIGEVVAEEFHKIGKVDLINLVKYRSPSILEAFLEPNSKLFDSVKCLDNLIRISIRTVLDPTYLSKVVIKIGMGGSIYPLSIRIPAQILGAISIMENLCCLKKKGLITELPFVHIFKADYVSSKVNGLPINNVHKITEDTFFYMREYINKFHPRVARYFCFDIDMDWDLKTQEVLNLMAKYLESIKKDLTDNSSFQRILTMAKNSGGELGKKNAPLYLSSHPLYQEDFLVPTVDKIFMQREFDPANYPEAVISIGGSPEKDFYEIRMILRNNLPNLINDFYTPMVIQFFTNICKLITYGKEPRDGDIFLRDAEHACNHEFRKVATDRNWAIKRDIKALEEDTYGQIWSFAKDINSRIITNKY